MRKAEIKRWVYARIAEELLSGSLVDSASFGYRIGRMETDREARSLHDAVQEVGQEMLARSKEMAPSYLLAGDTETGGDA